MMLSQVGRWRFISSQPKKLKVCLELQFNILKKKTQFLLKIIQMNQKISKFKKKMMKNFKCGKQIFVNRQVKLVLSIELVKRRFTSLQKGILCPNNKNKNGNKQKKFANKHKTMTMTNSQASLVNGNKYSNNKIIIKKTRLNLTKKNHKLIKKNKILQ